MTMEDNFDMGQAEQAVAQAPPEEVDAHRNLLQQAMGMLQGQGVDTNALTAQAGASTANPQAMSHGDLVQTTLALARQHPEIVAMVAQQFPQARGILNMALGGGQAGGSGGGMFGGLLGQILGR